jgi:hypothetical protein
MKPVLYNLNLVSDSTITDSAIIKFWHPDDLIDSIPTFSSKTVIYKNGTAIVSVPGNFLGGYYYISINHKNSVETWSASTVRLLSGSSYDFSSSLTKAYRNNTINSMRFLATNKYAIFSGDLNQDGSINLLDLQKSEISSKNTNLGFFNDDVNGDGVVDIFDLQIIENNKTLFINKARP